MNLNTFAGCSGPFIQNWPKDEPWIALIQRGQCTFNQKISHAESLNASGVLIYDHEEGDGTLQSMKVEPSTLPSVFTYHWKGKELANLFKQHGKVILNIKKGSQKRSEYPPERSRTSNSVRSSVRSLAPCIEKLLLRR